PERNQTSVGGTFAGAFVEVRMRNEHVAWVLFVCLGGTAYAGGDLRDAFDLFEGLKPVSTRRMPRARVKAKPVVIKAPDKQEPPAPFRPWLAGSGVAVDARNG